jgi:putative FmdB family regulatory protein
MPIYAYACKECEHTLDALQKIADEPLVDCPACGKPGLKRLLSAPRFRLKGTGWYETDFKKDGQRNLAGEKETAGKGEAGKKDASADKASSDTAPVAGKPATPPSTDSA